MNGREPTATPAPEETLLTYTDRLARGQTPAPVDELEATALRVQQTLRSSATRSAVMPATVKREIWEDIMRQTISTPTSRFVRPRSGAIAGDRRAESAGATGAPRRAEWKPARWGGFATIALALLLVLTGGTTWWAINGRGGGRGQAGIGLAPSTTAPAVAAVASPSGAADVATTCDFSADIPLIPDWAGEGAPVAGTALFTVRNDPTGVDPRGALELACPGQPVRTLAENVIGAGPGPWPGIVTVYVLAPGDDLNASTNAEIDIASGARLDFGRPEKQNWFDQWVSSREGNSPWVIGPSPVDPSVLTIADLRTMTARPLAEVAGGTPPDGTPLLASTPADDGTLAISGFAPGELLILGSSFDDVRRVQLPDALQHDVSAIWLSPDGTHAAVAKQTGGESGRSIRYGLIDLADGSALAVSDAITPPGDPRVLWIENGQAFAYLDGATIVTRSIDGNEPARRVFTADSELQYLQTTTDPEVVVAATNRDHGSDAEPDQTAQDVVFAVNVATGAVHRFEGIDASLNASWITDAGALVMYDWDDANPETTTFRVFDPVTGASLGQIADAPSVQPRERTMPTLGRFSVAITADGRIEVMAIGTQQIYAFEAGPDGLTMRRIASPEGLLADVFLTANLALSPDGRQLGLNGEEDEGRTRYLTSLTGEQPAWVEIPNTVPGPRGAGMLTFVAGTGGG